jgi:IS1 family transposase
VISHAKGLTPWLPCLSHAGIAAVLTSRNRVLLPTVSRSTVVACADGKAARILAVQPIQQNAKKKSFGRKLWRSIPARYRRGACYTDFWEAYQAVIPLTKHRPVGKETGQTAHSERFNNTLRQRLARLVRKTLSFSKSKIMHEICLRLFIWRYNLEIRAKLSICARV